MLEAIGSFLATLQHFYSAYALFTVAAAMAVAAISVSYWGDYRLKRGRRELGEVLVELSQCELAAHEGQGGADYTKVLERIKNIKSRVQTASKHLGDSSIESRFLAVNVLDVQLDEATKMHFIHRAQGDFWTMYQQIKGWRACVVGLLQELRR